jgi:N6-L-threonylcarbamoyladenine synthase
MNEAREILSGRSVSVVGVSTRPRNLDGSYMPCFLVGTAVAESIAAIEGIEIKHFSHQCGHVMAALYSSGRRDLLDGREFCAFHVSGGTTEMLKVRAVDSGFSAELIGGTADLNAGQVIDRIGVMMGLPFPAGPHIEALALKNDAVIPKKRPKLSGFEVNLSGLENMAERMYKETGNERLVSAFVLDYVGEALSLLAEKYEDAFGKSEFVFAGGVMSNSIIKSKLASRFSASFAEPAFSADNAVGIAALCIK